MRGAGQVLQIVWGFKELRRPLEKDGWKKTDFMVNPNPPGTKRSNGGHDDSTHPLIDRSEHSDRVLLTLAVANEGLPLWTLSRYYLCYQKESAHNADKAQYHPRATPDLPPGKCCSFPAPGCALVLLMSHHHVPFRRAAGERCRHDSTG